MSNQIVKKQHYVWRAYLKAWSNKDKIASYHLHSSKIITTDLMNVAQQRYFNKISKIGELEMQFLEHLCQDVRGPIKPMLDDLIHDLKLYNGIKEIQEKITNTIPEPLDILEKNGFEYFHTIIEQDGNHIINCKNIEDLHLLDDDKLNYQTLMFVCSQYFRTKKQKDTQIEGFKNTPLNIENIYNILVVISAAKLAQNISFDPNIRYSFLEITNENSFITCDQPIINLSGNDLDPNGYSKELVFYYPISPKYAIIIDFVKNSQKYVYKAVNDTEVLELNNQILTEAHEFIFADSESKLNDFFQ